MLTEREELTALLGTLAHDLRHSARSIAMAVQRLQRMPDAVSEAGRPRLEEILAAARAQDSLLSAVVEFDQASYGVERDPLLPLRLVIQGARMKMEARRQAVNGEIQVEELPACATPSRLSRVIEKVLENSLKFYAAGATPVILVRAEAGAETVTVRVDDQGIGIPAEYREAVFLPFKRLHSQKEYAGHGLGLSVCRRLMENMGGTISFGEAERGASVRIALPAHGGA